MTDHAAHCVIGAGPSGLACADVLTRASAPCRVLEQDADVGGMCRTIDFHGYLFDLGGHRFLSKDPGVNALWRSVLGDDLHQVQRLSRIFYRRRFFNYPLSFLNTFWNLGPVESVWSVGSFFASKVFHRGDEETFEGWIIRHFGRRLYEIFFKSYTEKVWGMECRHISAEWAKQRIMGLSLRAALQKALLGHSARAGRTLYERFLYPVRGPGQFYGRLADRITDAGGEITRQARVERIFWCGRSVEAVGVTGPDGDVRRMTVDHLFSSMAAGDVIRAMDPRPPEAVIAAAEQLRFRGFISVNVILDKETVFPDQWIYVHSPEVKLGRIQNYKNWSPAMVADYHKTTLGLEYFCSPGDAVWEMNDEDMIGFALDELERTGIVSRRYLINAFVTRCPQAYPVYALGYRAALETVRHYLTGFENLYMMGRQGLFRYCNSDHAMIMGRLAAEKALGRSSADLWATDGKNGYLETEDL